MAPEESIRHIPINKGDMRFRDSYRMARENGRCSSASKVDFFELSEKGERLNGKILKLSAGTELQEYIVGDSGFPLLWLTIPFQGRELPETKTEFNKCHYATRLVVHRALAGLKDVWRMIHGVMWRPDKTKLPRVILACCILRNIIIDMEGDVLDELTLTVKHDPEYRPEACDMADKSVSVSRDKLALYLSGKLHA